MLERHLSRPAAVAGARTGEVEGVEVVAIPGAVRTRLAERRDGDHHETGVDLLQLRVTEIPLTHLPRQVVLDQYVRPAQQAREQLAAFRDRHIAGHAPFVRVVDEKEPALLRVSPVTREGTRPACSFARRRLHLDHVGAVVAEELRAERRGDHLSEIEDLDAGQCARAGCARRRFRQVHTENGSGIVRGNPRSSTSAAMSPSR